MSWQRLRGLDLNGANREVVRDVLVLLLVVVGVFYVFGWWTLLPIAGVIWFICSIAFSREEPHRDVAGGSDVALPLAVLAARSIYQGSHHRPDGCEQSDAVTTDGCDG